MRVRNRYNSCSIVYFIEFTRSISTSLNFYAEDFLDISIFNSVALIRRNKVLFPSSFSMFLFLFNKDKRIPCESDKFVSSVLSSIKSYDSPLSSKSANRDDSH